MGKESPCQGCECWVDCVKPCQEWRDWFVLEWNGICDAGRELRNDIRRDCRSDERETTI